MLHNNGPQLGSFQKQITIIHWPFIVTSGLDESFALSHVGDKIAPQELTKLIKRMTYLLVLSKLHLNILQPHRDLWEICVSKMAKCQIWWKLLELKCCTKKKRCRSSCNNYRPISTLPRPIWEKILENIVKFGKSSILFPHMR